MKVILLTMKDQKINILDRAHLVFLSFFGTGYSPKAPGTVGSFATIPFMFLFSTFNLSLNFLIGFIIVLTVMACYSAHYIQEKFKTHDPGWIVIDEVIGMLITWLFIYPSFDLQSIFILFILFRFFDIVKIFPANFIDKNVKNGAGTILDDVVSGIYAGLILYGCKYFSII